MTATSTLDRCETPGRHRPTGAWAPRRVLDPGRIPIAMCLAGLLAWWIGCAGVHPRNADGWGLASTLTWPVWLGIGLTAVAAVVAVLRTAGRLTVLAATGILIVELYGLQPFTEERPRTTTAWLHLGFVDQFATLGAPAEGIDARFSWPGFFAWWGMLSDAGAKDGLTAIANWTPVAMAVICAVLVCQLARSLGASPRSAQLATLLFVVLNWIEQDYFSPQATAYVLALGVVVVVLGAARGSRRERAAVQVFLPLVIGAVVVTHQLTPAMLALQLVVIAVCRFARAGPLIWVVIAVELTWFVVGAHEFWGGQQLGLMTGGLGDVRASLGSNLTARIDAVDTGVATIRRLRLVVFLATLVLGGWGLLIRWRARRPLLLPALLALAPAATVIQGYGGEMFMRCAFFALPPLAVLGGEAIEAVATHRLRAARAVPYLVVVAAAGALVLLRGGNDGFSYISRAETRLVDAALSATNTGDTMLLATEQGPVRTSRVADIKWRNLTALCGPSPHTPSLTLSECTELRRPTTVVVTRSMARWGEIVAGRRPDWADAQVRIILGTRRYSILASNRDGVVLERNKPGRRWTR